MSGTQAAVRNASIVVIGPLSPALFQPHWMAAQGLITEAEAENVQNLVVTHEFSNFTTEWLSLNSVGEKLTLTTELEPYFSLLRDLAASLIELFDRIPVSAIGLNRAAHFDLGSVERWHRVGHALAPKAGIWDDILENPGTRRLAIVGERKGRPGNVNVAVEPSNVVDNGLFVEVNDHFVAPDGVGAGSDWAAGVIAEEWSAHEEHAARVFDRMMSIGALDDIEGGSR